MLDRDAFVEGRQARWTALEALLGRRLRTAGEWIELSSLYRSVCADLARARSHGLPTDILRYLDALAGRAHNALYGARESGDFGILRIVTVGFPREVRAQWRPFLLASALFYAPFLFAAIASALQPDLATLILSEGALHDLELSYGDAGVQRSAAQDATMAGFYVWNNVGIAFRCFATGVLFGLGSAYYLVFNGLTIGTVAGYLGSVGYGHNLLSFVAGHAAWELTGVVVAGTAGLRMGWALLVTGGRTRAGSLRAAGPGLVRLVVGAATLLLIAAAIEGFWSTVPLPLVAKVCFGIAQIGIVAAWLGLGGRRR